MSTKNHGYLHEIADRILDFYLSGEDNVALNHKIQAWLLDAANRQEKEEALRRQWERRVRESKPDTRAYHLLLDLRRRLGIEQRSARPLQLVRFSRPVRHSLGRVATRVAAVMVPCLLAGGALWWYTSREVEQPVVVAVQAAPKVVTVCAGDSGRVHVELPDGSQAWVRRNGEISYSETFNDDRVVNLKGEAFFSVTKQDGEPFVVASEGISVRVLGTEFMVHAGDDAQQSTVEVTSGRVEVSAGNQKRELNPNDLLVFDEALARLTVDKVTGELSAASWKDMNLDFENSTLDEVFRRVGALYGVNIEVQGQLSPVEHLTVRFAESESLEEVLSIIKSTLRTFDFETNGDTVTITRSNNI